VNAFSPRILKNASRQLKNLDPPVAKRIVDQIAWLAAHFEEIKPEALTGDLTG
jgi:mRNA-degrading endonuclease RelE of RelBE toxin-antitoxin system